MNKICFIIENLNPNDGVAQQSIALIKEVAVNKQVQVLTTYSEEEVPDLGGANIQLFRPFKKWNWLEITGAFQLINNFSPDLMVYIQPFYKYKSPFHISHILASSLDFYRKQRLFVVYFEPPSLRFQKSQHEVLLQQAEKVLLSEQFNWDAFLNKFKNINFDFLPGFYNSNFKQEDFWLTSTDLNILSVPMNFAKIDPSVVQAILHFLQHQKKWAACFYDGWGKCNTTDKQSFKKHVQEMGLQGRVIIPGPISLEQKNHILKNSKIILTSHLPINTKLRGLIDRSVNFNVPLLINKEQSSLFSPNTENDFIASTVEGIFEKLYVLSERKELFKAKVKNLKSVPTIKHNDDSFNAISRLFT